MSLKFSYLVAVALVSALAACTSADTELGDIKSADYVEEDLTRWAHLPYASLPPPRFIRVIEKGRYNSTGGAPNLDTMMEREVAAVENSFSTMRVRASGQGRRTSTMFRSYMGIHQMSSRSSGGWGQGSRRILEVVPGRTIPPNPVIKSRYPELQGVRAADLSHDFTWKIRIGQGVGSERWFKVSSEVVDVAETAVTVNGKVYLIDAYLIDYSIENVQGIYRSDYKFWYLPVLGWVAKYEIRSESRSGISNTVGDDISFEVTPNVLAEFERYARPVGS